MQTVSLPPKIPSRALLVMASSRHALHLGPRRDARAFNYLSVLTFASSQYSIYRMLQNHILSNENSIREYTEEKPVSSDVKLQSADD